MKVCITYAHPPPRLTHARREMTRLCGGNSSHVGHAGGVKKAKREEQKKNKSPRYKRQERKQNFHASDRSPSFSWLVRRVSRLSTTKTWMGRNSRGHELDTRVTCTSSCIFPGRIPSDSYRAPFPTKGTKVSPMFRTRQPGRREVSVVSCPVDK